jgi:hypothetical protein
MLYIIYRMCGNGMVSCVHPPERVTARGYMARHDWILPGLDEPHSGKGVFCPRVLSLRAVRLCTIKNLKKIINDHRRRIWS